LEHSLLFFDCYCQVGRYGTPGPGEPLEPREVLDAMQRAGISRALAIHALAKELAPIEGNDLIVMLAREHQWIEPCWVAMPHHTREMPAAGVLLAAMRNSGVRSVRLFPSLHGWRMNEYGTGELLSALGAACVPTFVDLDQTNWDEVDQVCATHPGLPLVVLRVTYRIDRTLYPLLEKHQNLRIEISGYQPHRGIEEIAARFGAHRLLFGSGLPVFEPGSAVAMVTYAELPEDQKQMIAAANLEALLAQAKP